MQEASHGQMTLAEWADALGVSHTWIDEKNRTAPCCVNAVLKAHGPWIRQRPAAFYKRILESLTVGEHPVSAFYVERLSADVFSGGHAPSYY